MILGVTRNTAMLLLIQSEFEGEKTIFTNLVIITLKNGAKGRK